MQNDIHSELLAAFDKGYAAIRAISRLTPAGGPHAKVFPPTYEGGKYAYEERLVNGGIIKTVLLDSVQSQANRMEHALLDLYRSGRIKFPLVKIDFSKSQEIKKLGITEITSLEVPHRIADATILYSMNGDKEFIKSKEGELLESASVSNATPLLQICPTALIFGQWLTHGRRGGLGSKFQRAIASEIVGYNAVEGIGTGGRIDPLPISAKVPVWIKPDGEWTLDENEAEMHNKGKKKDEDKYEKKKASNIGLGNIPPSFIDNETKKKLAGGVTIDYAEQVVVLSLIALRKLRFPVDGKESDEANRAARTLLASLALCAMTAQSEQGFDLRSRCLLIPQGSTTWELVPADGSGSKEFTLNTNDCIQTFGRAVEDVKRAGLPWREEPIVLSPSSKLVELIEKSIQIQLGESIEVE
jgi:CRISPR-associated protein Csb1